MIIKLPITFAKVRLKLYQLLLSGRLCSSEAPVAKPGLSYPAPI